MIVGAGKQKLSWRAFGKEIAVGLLRTLQGEMLYQHEREVLEDRLADLLSEHPNDLQEIAKEARDEVELAAGCEV